MYTVQCTTPPVCTHTVWTHQYARKHTNLCMNTRTLPRTHARMHARMHVRSHARTLTRTLWTNAPTLTPTAVDDSHMAVDDSHMAVETAMNVFICMYVWMYA